MSEEKKYELKQVSVRLKLCEETPLYSTEPINTPRKAVEVLKDLMRQLDRECVIILNLDTAGSAINYTLASLGGLGACSLEIRDLLKASIMSNASTILMAHNHPSYRLDKPVPSKEDNATTLKVMMGAWMIGIPLVDHLIVAGGSGSIYSYKKELGDRFSIEGLQEIVGQDRGIPVFNEYSRERLSVRSLMNERKTVMKAKNREGLSEGKEMKSTER